MSSEAVESAVSTMPTPTAMLDDPANSGEAASRPLPSKPTAAQAKGSVLIHQKMFESRLFFVDKLIDMGAQIILCDPHRAVVIGHNHGFKLRGGNMTSPDIRAGIALLIAAMSADGISRIHNIEQIDRGYQNIEGRLNAIGARITRI